jgi:hypothetical protein
MSIGPTTWTRGDDGITQPATAVTCNKCHAGIVVNASGVVFVTAAISRAGWSAQTQRVGSRDVVTHLCPRDTERSRLSTLPLLLNGAM